MKNIPHPFLLAVVLMSLVSMLILWPGYAASTFQLSTYMASAVLALTLCLMRLKKILVAERVKAKR
ncbi:MULTISPECIES: hypothetical protein [Stenotrophomonas]|uniref:hypothetical protein n=1 Tax=Stenotrophomonas TaxID=40323 RepID=UPI0013DBA472|nr:MULTISPECIES: hypothetical protein [Stenotrophomonas]MBH1550308.1 hypothetical protein [Stenotrophomonas maltophilia]MBW8375023.1 hypothetical protein [Stenotrophomonas sp.]HDS1082655.1 hypothetical protein [Stenotrophomonas maltophilia]